MSTNARYITTAQAAAHLGIARPLVIRLCQQGRITAQKFGRDWMIDEKALSQYKPRKVGRPKQLKPAGATGEKE